MAKPNTAEHRRLRKPDDWRMWGPYLAEREWGTLREDFGGENETWEAFPFEHAHCRAYRWAEDGLLGFCDKEQRLVMSLALWNGRDPILKERPFGLSNDEGNHGEDVKDYFWFLDGLPSHAYAKALYRYPQVEYPYRVLKERNKARGKHAPEVELLDVLRGDFEAGRYFDVWVEYAKASADDVLCRITAVNHSKEAAPLHLLPHLYFRNTWAWGLDDTRPVLRAEGDTVVAAEHPDLRAWWAIDAGGADVRLLFADNETNTELLYGTPGESPFSKDAIGDAVVHGRMDVINERQEGTKCAAHVQTVIPAGESFTVRVRLSASKKRAPFSDFDSVFEKRIRETDEFYAAVQPPELDDDQRLVQRQAFAGLTWSKAYYHYDVNEWMNGDAVNPAGAEGEKNINVDWTLLRGEDVISVPDTWEYPFFAAWDLAFQTVTISLIDTDLAKQQMLLLLQDRYMHPDGQIPGHEGDFGEVNPPVHAWAALRIYQFEQRKTGKGDTEFLERAFGKLLLNAAWWFEPKEYEGKGRYKGGFLGMDNISVFNRSHLPTGGYIEQADAHGWVAFNSLVMLRIAIELAHTRPMYEDMALRFLETFIHVAQTHYEMDNQGCSIWDEADGFFYDVLHPEKGDVMQIRIRSYAGLIPFLATLSLEESTLKAVPRLRERVEWYRAHRPDLLTGIQAIDGKGEGGGYLLAVLERDKLERVLSYVFDPNEFLSDHGIRSLSKFHATHPITQAADDEVFTLRYEPGMTSEKVMGGNSNWRGPIWAPISQLIIESLRHYHAYYGDSLKVSLNGNGASIPLDEAADDLCRRLVGLFTRAEDGTRPVFNHDPIWQNDPNWRDYILFYEHFHGDAGYGLGAEHQNGWTALIATLIDNGGMI